MKLRNKIILMAAGMVIVVMLISTIAVSFLITKQNQKAARDHLHRSFKIVHERIDSVQSKLLEDVRQMATVDDMGTKISFVAGEKGSSSVEMFENSFVEITRALYNVGLSSKVNRIRAYDTDGDLVAFVRIEDKTTLMGFNKYGLNNATLQIATAKTGEQPDSDGWGNTAAAHGVALKLDGKVPDRSDAYFKVIKGDLALVATAPATAQAYDAATDSLKSVQVGCIITEKTLTKDFAESIAELTDTEINIFTPKGLSSGTLASYITPATNLFDMNTTDGAEPVYSEISIEDSGQDYYQGVIPLFSNTEQVAALSSLYSRAITRANTVQMIKMLFLISIICVLFFLPVAYLIAIAFAKPILRVEAFAGALEKGDLSQRLPTGKDEIGKMGAALNAVVEELKRKTDVAMAVSQGDLRQQVNVASSLDDLGKALATMVDHMNDIIINIQETADAVDGGTKRISNANRMLSENATRQASSFEEISSAITEISARTKVNADNTQQADKIANTARQDSSEGMAYMKEMLTAINAISDSSNEISSIIKTIDDIAFQTNLLALNAAVEAARAGKHGKGFAVVAQEVRSLAARSAKAAQETAALIEAAVERVKDGNAIAENTGQALEKISTGVGTVSDLIAEIAAASDEQAKGIEQVGHGVSQVDTVTQENAANAQETLDAMEDLSARAARVRELLAFFKVRNGVETTDTAKAVMHGEDVKTIPGPDYADGDRN
ncbi:MAG: methyl-accepting chemotaxis protein [Thermodesulfobacteriota bacterium]|nr:methyl-accepting chemotaxis protein [Thermodesulfobacteriota bacterium]